MNVWSYVKNPYFVAEEVKQTEDDMKIPVYEYMGCIDNQTLNRCLKEYQDSDFDESKRFIPLGLYSVDYKKMKRFLTDDPDNEKLWLDMIRSSTQQRQRRDDSR